MAASPGRPAWVDDELAALPFLQQMHRLLNVLKADVVSDEGGHIDPATRTEKAACVLPGLPDPATEDAVYRHPLLDDELVEVEGHRRHREAKKADPASWTQAVEGLADGAAGARHLQGHVELSSAGGQHLLDGVGAAGIHDCVGAGRAGQGHAVLVDVGGDHAGRPLGPGYGDAKQPYGSTSSDQHYLVLERAAGGRVHGVPERLLDAGDVNRHRAIGDPRVDGGDGDQLSEAAVSIKTEDLHVAADVPLADQALVAGAVGDMGLGGDEVADADVFRPRPDSLHCPAALVSDDPRGPHPLGHPVAPLVDGEVGAADRRRLHPDQDLILAGPRLWDLGYLYAGLRPRFDDCFQLGPILIPLRLPTRGLEEQMVTAYVLINTSPGRAMDVAKKLQGTTGITVADAITGEYDVIARIEGADVNAIGGVIVESIQKIEGVFKTVTCLAVT